jgi:hypothetical protein
MHADCLLKNTPTKRNKYVVNQKLHAKIGVVLCTLYLSLKCIYVIFCFVLLVFFFILFAVCKDLIKMETLHQAQDTYYFSAHVLLMHDRLFH